MGALIVLLPIFYALWINLSALYWAVFYKNAEENGIVYKYSKLLRRAYAVKLLWNGTENAKFVIPDRFMDCKVKGLGTKKIFDIEITVPGLDWMDRYGFRESKMKASELKQTSITIALGQYVDRVSDCLMLFKYVSTAEDDPKPIYKMKYLFEVDERNENFITKRNLLYYFDGERVESTRPV